MLLYRWTHNLGLTIPAHGDEDREGSGFMLYPAIQPKMLKGTEAIVDEDGKTVSDVSGYWRWAYSNILDNTERGAFAEYLVACALGISDRARVNWDKYDLLSPEGVSIEIKSSGYIQTWEQEKLSNITFSIQPTYGWDSVTNTYSSEKVRQADVYVFCVLKHTDQSTIDPLDIGQWDFYVLGTGVLDRGAEKQKSISLNSLLKMGAEKCSFHSLHSKILQWAGKEPD